MSRLTLVSEAQHSMSAEPVTSLKAKLGQSAPGDIVLACGAHSWPLLITPHQGIDLPLAVHQLSTDLCCDPNEESEC